MNKEKIKQKIKELEELLNESEVEWIKNPDTPDLLWEKYPKEKKMTWEEAKQYAESIGGRLPTVKEFINVYDYETAQLKLLGFTSGFHWTSTTYAGNKIFAMDVNLNDGSVNYNYKEAMEYVRCVKEYVPCAKGKE